MMAFWVRTLSSIVGLFSCFGGTCYLHLYGDSLVQVVAKVTGKRKWIDYTGRGDRTCAK